MPNDDPESGRRLSSAAPREWWLENYTIEEIIELAACLDGFGI